MRATRQQDKRPEPRIRPAGPVPRTIAPAPPSPSPRFGLAAVAPRSGLGGNVQAGLPAPNPDGLPEPLKSNMERMSGLALDDVRIHRNSSRPAQLGALAFTQGSDIHLAPGEEGHLAHEAWHAVQQKQGRVKPTLRIGGVAASDDLRLEREADAMAHRCPATLLAESPSVVQAPVAARGVVQRRTYNPYGDATESGGGSTAHHIVSDELLTAAIGYLEEPDQAQDQVKAKAEADAEAKGVRQQFLPVFDSLTMRQLAETAAITIGYSEQANGQEKNVNAKVVRADNADAAYTKPFGSLSNEEQGRIRLAGLTFAEFRQGYDDLRQGRESTVPAKVAEDLLHTFFEWQAGNLMLGPSSEKRLEPGAKNEFDADARFILDKASHVASLSAIYDKLLALKLDWEKAAALSDEKRIAARKLVKAGVKEVLGKMAKLNAGISLVKAHDESLWAPVKSQKQADLLEHLEGKKRPGFKVGAKIPAALVPDLIAKKKEDAKEVRTLLRVLKIDSAPKDAGTLLGGTLKFAASGKKTVRLSVAGYDSASVEIERDYSFDTVVAAAKKAVAAAYDAAG
ncbi:MAG TPA: DUF4157 domain-containing protein [Allosphingosinicella sp.]|nr:DUF4157 domain-containing protein [Allosphingosinicella sp.]